MKIFLTFNRLEMDSFECVFSGCSFLIAASDERLVPGLQLQMPTGGLFRKQESNEGTDFFLKYFFPIRSNIKY